MLVNLRNDCGPLPNRPAHPLDRARAHIAYRENTRRACLEGTRRRRSRRSRIRSGQDEAIGIHRDAASFQPTGIRIRADEEEQIADVLIAHASVTATTPADAQESAASIPPNGAE